MSGRKRPRLDDVDVIPAGDIDQDELQDLLDEVIQSSNPEPETQQDPEPESIGKSATNAVKQMILKRKQKTLIGLDAIDTLGGFINSVLE